MTFSTLIDQDFAVGTIKRAINARKVQHAYLFEGPAGVGKRLCATSFAMTLNCEQGSDDACGECQSCKKISRNNHPDIRTLSPLEGKKNILIDAVREAENWIRIRPHEGKAKVLIIEPADAMTESAANALLKTLEEPRVGCFLVLVTSVGSSLLATVRSRCQSVRFNPLSVATVEKILIEEGMEPGTAQVTSVLSDGSMEKAYQYTSDDVKVRLGAVAKILKCSASLTPGPAMEVAAALRGDRIEVSAILELLLSVLAEILWIQTQGKIVAAESPLMQFLGEDIEKLAQSGNLTSTSGQIAAVNRALTGMKRNNMNPQLALESVIVSMRKNSGLDRIGI